MADSPKKISVLIATDYPILSDSLVSIFKAAKDLKMVGCASTVENLILQLNKFRPQVLLLDISIPCEKFSDLLAQITGKETKVLVINQDLSPTETIEALRYGAHGVIGKKTTPELLCRCVRAVASGDIWVGRSVTGELVQFLRSRNAPAEGALPGGVPSDQTAVAGTAFPSENRFGLTKREMQIVNALVEAQTNKDIAETFGISEYTVKHHLTNIFDKLGVYNRVELALFAISHQLCPSGIGHAPNPTPALAVDGKIR